jgi:hypothetical protein
MSKQCIECLASNAWFRFKAESEPANRTDAYTQKQESELHKIHADFIKRMNEDVKAKNVQLVMISSIINQYRIDLIQKIEHDRKLVEKIAQDLLRLQQIAQDLLT